MQYIIYVMQRVPIQIGDALIKENINDATVNH